MSLFFRLFRRHIGPREAMSPALAIVYARTHSTGYRASFRRFR